MIAGRDIHITASGQERHSHLVLQGTKANANHQLEITSNHNLLLDTDIDYEYSYEKTTKKHGKWHNRKTTTTHTTHEYTDAKVATLHANNILLQTQGISTNALNIFGAQMSADDNIKLSSSGHINLYVVEDSRKTHQDSHTKKKFAGIRYGSSKSRWQYHQISTLPASLTANYINSQSAGNTTLEGTQFSYLTGATIRADNKISLLPATSVLYEQFNQDSNYVVWQSMTNRGKYQESATLPSFTGITAPVFEARGGLIVQIPISEKDAQKRTLKEQIINLAKQPEYSYLNNLIGRQDIDWQEIILSDQDWNYKQQGLTPAGAALVAIAVAAATGGAGSSLSTSIVGATGSTALGAAGKAAFINLSQQATISLINNQGDVAATLRELGNKQNVKQLTFAIVGAGISSQLNSTLLKNINTGSGASFSDKFIKGVVDGTSQGLLESAVYGTDLTEALEKNLRAQIVKVGTSEVFSHAVKPIDADSFSRNIAHKLAAALTGCVSAAANKQDCEAGAIGAAVGEMWGDWRVNAETQKLIDAGIITEGTPAYNQILNESKLIAGVVAAFAGEDVNVAAGMAEEAARNNQLSRAILGFGKNEDKEFIEDYKKYCSQNYSQSSCQNILTKWKNISYKKNAGLSDVQIKAWENDVNRIYNAYVSQCGTNDTNCQKILRTARDYYAISHGGDESFLMSMEISLNTYMNGGWDTIKNKGMPYVIVAMTGITELSRPKAKVSGAGKNTNNKANSANSSKNTTCLTPPMCFTAGTLIHTIHGLKPIESIEHGDLIWSRQEFGTEYGYRPVIATKATPNQDIYEVVVKHSNNTTETFKTTSEHPFWVEGIGWLKASLLEQGMTLLDKHGSANVTIISQAKLDHTETVYNFEVQDFHTYHIGEYGVWVHNANCCDLVNQNPVTETKRGVISNKKLTNNAIELDLTPQTQKQLKDIIDNGDISGAKTEDLFENVVKEHGGKVLTGGKYGSNNGYDHVVIFKDTDGKIYLTMTVDSKQLNSKGVKLDPKAAGGNMQMSDDWDDEVLGRLGKNSEASQAIRAAKENGTLVKGVAYVDKNSKTLKLVRINPTNPTNPTKKKEKKKP